MGVVTAESCFGLRVRQRSGFLGQHGDQLPPIPAAVVSVGTCPALCHPFGFGDEPGGVVRELLVHEMPRWSLRRLGIVRIRLFRLHIRFDPRPGPILRLGSGRFLKCTRGLADYEAVAPSTVPSYDPRVIEQFAEKLYRKASAFVAGSVVVGGALGAGFGAVPLTSLGDAWPIPSMFGFATLLAGAVCGAVVGYVIGDTRSFGYRLQAQAALCQLQTERNTAFVAAAVSAARTTPKAPQQQAAPAPPPAQPEQPASPPVTPPVSAARVA